MALKLTSNMNLLSSRYFTEHSRPYFSPLFCKPVSSLPSGVTAESCWEVENTCNHFRTQPRSGRCLSISLNEGNLVIKYKVVVKITNFITADTSIQQLIASSHSLFCPLVTTTEQNMNAFTVNLRTQKTVCFLGLPQSVVGVGGTTVIKDEEFSLWQTGGKEVQLLNTW